MKNDNFMKDEKIIMFDSPEAAEFKTITLTGWWSAPYWGKPHGSFFGDDEIAARLYGATHKKCEDCDNVTKVYWGICKECKIKYRKEKYKNLESVEWDEETPLYSEYADDYFHCKEEILDFLRDENPTINIEDLELYICEPVMPSLINEEYWQDEIPDDLEIEHIASEKVLLLLSELNDALSEEKPWSWCPGTKRPIINIPALPDLRGTQALTAE